MNASGHTGTRFAVRAAGAGASLCGKTSAASPKIHPSNPSIHPEPAAPGLCRSRLLLEAPAITPELVSRLRLAAVNRFHPSSCQHRHKLHQWNSLPAIREKPKPSAAPGERPGAAFHSDNGWNKSARQREAKNTCIKNCQSGHGNRYTGRTAENAQRAISVLPEQPPQPRKKLVKPRQAVRS